jgi:hypothetical protein
MIDGPSKHGKGNHLGAVVHNDGFRIVLYSFGGTATNGCHPYAGLTAAGGMLYGVSDGARTSPCISNGTIFRVAPNGAETTLRTFPGGNGGLNPYGGLLSLDGKLYGTASEGGYHMRGTTAAAIRVRTFGGASSWSTTNRAIARATTRRCTRTASTGAAARNAGAETRKVLLSERKDRTAVGRIAVRRRAVEHAVHFCKSAHWQSAVVPVVGKLMQYGERAVLSDLKERPDVL